MNRYFDFFTRAGHSIASYEDRLGSSAKESEQNEESKFQTLFSDAFGHHVHFNLDVPAILKIERNNARRFISKDSLSSYFLDKLYNPPNIYLSGNLKKRESDLRSFGHFTASISQNPVTKENPEGDTEGSNLFTFLVGEIGTGKTLLLCKVIREIKKREFEAYEDPSVSRQLLVPVYFDFEYEMKGEGGSLLDIDDDFYGKVARAIDRSIQQISYARNNADESARLVLSPLAPKISQLISFIQRLHNAGIRLLLILDNTDGYHYHYSKYSFFPEYYRQQQESV